MLQKACAGRRERSDFQSNYFHDQLAGNPRIAEPGMCVVKKGGRFTFEGLPGLLLPEQLLFLLRQIQ